MIRRIFDLIPTAARQFVPLNGIFGSEWRPASAIAVYWFESVLLAAVAVVLCFVVKQRISDRAIAEARTAGDAEHAAAIQAEQAAARRAGVNPHDVLLFHGVSLAFFGVFLGAIFLILTGNGYLERPFDWGEFRDGATAIAIVIAIGFAIELVLFPPLSVAAVQSRVDACNGRWALLWLLGFVGTALMVFTGRPGAFIGLFAVLKVTWEVWGALARAFNWKPVKERASPSS